MPTTLEYGTDTFYTVFEDAKTNEEILELLERQAGISARRELQLYREGSELSYYLRFCIEAIEEMIDYLGGSDRHIDPDSGHYGKYGIQHPSKASVKETVAFLIRSVWERYGHHFSEQDYSETIQICDRLGGVDDLLWAVWEAFKRTNPSNSILSHIIAQIRVNEIKDEIATLLMEQLESKLENAQNYAIRDLEEAHRLLNSLDESRLLVAVTEPYWEHQKRAIDLFVRLVNHNYQQIGRIDLESLQRNDSRVSHPYSELTDFETFKEEFDYKLRQCTVGLQ